MLIEEKIKFTAEDNTGAVFDAMTKRIKTLEDKLKDVGVTTKKTAQSVNVFSSAFTFLKTGLIVGAMFKTLDIVKDLGVAFVKTTDQVNSLQNKLRSVSSGETQAKLLFGDLLDISIKYGVSLETNVRMLQRMALVQKSLGSSKSELVDLAATVNKIGIIGGSSSSELSFGLIQFVQMLSYSKTQAQELNSLIENIPMLADLIAKNFKKVGGEIGLSTGELKKLIETGVVSNKDIYEAVKRGAAEVDAQMKNMVPTFDLAFSSLSSGLTAVIERFENATGAAEWFNTTLKAMGEYAGSFALTDKERESSVIEKRFEVVQEIKALEATLERMTALNQRSPSSWRDEFIKKLREDIDELTPKYERLTKQAKEFRDAQAGIDKRSEVNPSEANEEDKKRVLDFYNASKTRLEALVTQYNAMAVLSQKTYTSDLARAQLAHAMKRKLEEINALGEKNNSKKNSTLSEEITRLANASLTSEEKLESKLGRVLQLLKSKKLTLEQINILESARDGITEKIRAKREKEKDHLNDIYMKVMSITDKPMADYIIKIQEVNALLAKGVKLTDDQLRNIVNAANDDRIGADPEFQRLRADATARINGIATPEQQRDTALKDISRGQKEGLYGEGLDGEAVAMAARMKVLDEYKTKVYDVTTEIGKVWEGLADTISTGMGDAVVDVISGQQTAGEAARVVLNAVFRQVVSGIVSIMAKKVLLAVFEKSALATTTTSSVAAAGTIAAAWTPAATMVSLASFGGNAAAASAGLVSTAAVAKGVSLVGVAHGGLSAVPTTGTYLLERGEKVVSNRDTPKLDRLLNREGGSSGGDPVVVNVNINAIDTQTGTAFLMKNKHLFVGAVQDAYTRRGMRGPMG